MPKLYRMCDANPNGVFEVSVSDAMEWNKKQFGIFWTVNEFNGPRRISNLTKINAWAIDLDHGSKQEQLLKINSGIPPTMVIESKNGYHVYWRSKNATAENWNAIMLDRLVPFYGADKNARDLARILRAPNYFHWKDTSDPFLVKRVWEYPVSYTEEQLAYYYPLSEESKKQKAKHMLMKKEFSLDADGFFNKLWELDCEIALDRLSGRPEVNHDDYTFRQNKSGTRQIHVNNKSTSCWIDVSGRIGSFSDGGPTIFQWIKWYGHNNKKTYQIIKEVFPEL